ncbi:MAG TPA: hypothetical protein VL326_10560 [Kofleriaceae bacterium]|nr:hypothetical protein [Kofleriaceae bacterium]
MQMREPFDTLSRLLSGATIPALRHLRDVPRAATPLPVVQAVAREWTSKLKLRRAS